MKSRLADEARQSLSEYLRRMMPEERRAAHVRHCQLMAQVRLAGARQVRVRRRSGPRPMRTEAAGQSALLMVDVAEVLSARDIRYAVI